MWQLGLQSKTRVTEKTIHEYQYADDAALLSSSLEELQRFINTLWDVYSSSGLTISINETEFLSMCEWDDASAYLTMNWQPLNNVQKFSYHSSVVTNACNLTSEVKQFIRLASTYVGRLSNRVFINRSLTITTKIEVYKAICLSVLLKWWNKIPHIKINR